MCCHAPTNDIPHRHNGIHFGAPNLAGCICFINDSRINRMSLFNSLSMHSHPWFLLWCISNGLFVAGVSGPCDASHHSGIHGMPIITSSSMAFDKLPGKCHVPDLLCSIVFQLIAFRHHQLVFFWCNALATPCFKWLEHDGQEMHCFSVCLMRRPAIIDGLLWDLPLLCFLFLFLTTEKLCLSLGRDGLICGHWTGGEGFWKKNGRRWAAASGTLSKFSMSLCSHHKCKKGTSLSLRKSFQNCWQRSRNTKKMIVCTENPLQNGKCGRLSPVWQVDWKC